MTVHMVFFMSEFSSSKIFQDNFDGTLSLSFSVVGSGENNLQKAYRFRKKTVQVSQSIKMYKVRLV